MSKGAIPVPYLIAIIFAVVIIGFIGYYFYTELAIFGGKLSESQCLTKRITFCTECLSGAVSCDSWNIEVPKCVGILKDSDIPSNDKCKEILYP